MNQILASIITIGDELLIGQVIDTNSAWMAQELNKNGFVLKNRVAVGDNKKDIVEALDNAIASTASIILLTGGLGPTADDITKPVLCAYFGGTMVLHEPTLQFITNFFTNNLNRPLIERNRQQAFVPSSCRVLLNEQGTAPAMLFEKNKKIIVAMPGVPFEMKWLMQQHVLPILLQKFSPGCICHKTLLISGISESFLAEELEPYEKALPHFISLAYLPHLGTIRLRLTAKGDDTIQVEHALQKQFDTLKNNLSNYIVLDEDVTQQEAIARMLIAKKQTVATAESCTGGYIAHLLSRRAGASTYYTGSVISYANAVKQNVLHVSKEALQSEGAVSESVVKQMAANILQLMQTDYAIAVSGIMGPSGGTIDKPVGFVWIAVANKEKIVTQYFQLAYDRMSNIALTANHALNMLRKIIV